jgi:site-specific DNA-adenine methylase
MKFFPISRLGNKQQDIKHFEKFLPKQEDITTVAEPFAGSFAVIRNKFFKCENIICADADKAFTEQLKIVMTNFDDFMKEKEIINKFFDDNNINPLKENRNIFMKTDKQKELLSLVKYHCILDLNKRGMWKRPAKTLKKEHYAELIELYKKIKWHTDFTEVFNICKDDEKAFVFIDPPYFSSFNKDYMDGAEKLDEKRNIRDTTGMYIDILRFLETAKCKVMLIVNSNAIIKYLFNRFYKGEYSRLYQLSKTRETLNIYCNY